MATNTKSSNFMRSKPGFGDGPSSSRSRIDLSASKKKSIEGSIRGSIVDAKNRSVSIGSKMTKNASSSQSKNASSSQSKAATKPAPKTRVKKVFSLPGQKFDVPEEREPLRIFYESLSEQIPSSEMAEFWLMEHGMLSPERAKKAFEKKQRKQKELRTGTPIKSPPRYVSSKPESSKRPQLVPKNGDVKAKKRIIDDDDDDDFVLSHKRRKS